MAGEGGLNSTKFLRVFMLKKLKILDGTISVPSRYCFSTVKENILRGALQRECGFAGSEGAKTGGVF
jgi:hypothetical protein